MASRIGSSEHIMTDRHTWPYFPDQTTVGCVRAGIVTFNNSSQQLKRLLASIENAAGKIARDGYRVEVATIDCGSPAKWPAARIPLKRLPTEGNLGFGGGMNRLLQDSFRHAEVSWFLCVNPDGYLHYNLLKEMIQCSLRYPDSLVEARQFPEEHPKQYDANTGLTLWASGACLLIPRKIYETIGGFDPNIFMFMEDVDYSWRARAAGFSVRVAPRALFAHSVLDRKPDTLIERYYYMSYRYLAYKWYHPAVQHSSERVMLERGYAPDGHLPKLPAIESPIPMTIAQQIADFSYGMVFAPRRW
jgi:GT2 family glycosyltransferase